MSSSGPEPVLSLKRLGDSTYTPNSQNVGCVAYESAFEDLEMFEKLARRYQVHGESRSEICRFNASVSRTLLFVINGTSDAGLGCV